MIRWRRFLHLAIGLPHSTTQNVTWVIQRGKLIGSDRYNLLLHPGDSCRGFNTQPPTLEVGAHLKWPSSLVIHLQAFGGEDMSENTSRCFSVSFQRPLMPTSPDRFCVPYPGQIVTHHARLLPPCRANCCLSLICPVSRSNHHALPGCNQHAMLITV